MNNSISIHLKWIKDHSVRSEPVKLIQEKIRNTLDHTGIGNDFMNGTLITQQLRESIDKLDYMKLKSFCCQRKWSSD
jgi:hypothetical protein